jgi:5-methylcytosine-specific restriction endonuclease McrA
MAVHILHGGFDNGDEQWLVRAAEKNLKSHSWIAPKSAQPDDLAVIFVRTAFFATARIASESHSRSDWAHGRYGTAIDNVRLIQPPISIGIIRNEIPELSWARYPRSITTLDKLAAKKVLALIDRRRKSRGKEVDDRLMDEMGFDELRARAYADARPLSPKKATMASYRLRSRSVHRFVLKRADGCCEGCGETAPFTNLANAPYLEPHHTIRLSDDGPDSPAAVIALCPNCHRRVHHSLDGDRYNEKLKSILRRLEARPPF